MLPVVVVIPAYQPQEILIVIVQALLKFDFAHIIVINDGSDRVHDVIFSSIAQNIGVTVLRHEHNQGKGAALQTAFTYWCGNFQTHTLGVVTADADGQHSVSDIVKIARELIKNPDHFHLGTRVFSKNIPLRSRFGNVLTQKLFHCITKVNLQDTQTGLRGIPVTLLTQLDCLRAKGYEYELEMLFLVISKKIPIEQHAIETIYVDENEQSHFNPIADSWKIYKSLFSYWMG